MQAVGHGVALCSKCSDCCAFGGVEPANHQSRGVCGFGLFTSESTDLTDEMTFCGAADRGVAGHESDAVDGEAEEEGFAAHA